MPGSRAGNETLPGFEVDSYRVMKKVPPPKLRLAASHIPSAPAMAVDVLSSTPSSNQPSWPDSATTDSPGVRCTSSTCMVVPRIVVSMALVIGGTSREP